MRTMSALMEPTTRSGAEAEEVDEGGAAAAVEAAAAAGLGFVGVGIDIVVFPVVVVFRALAREEKRSMCVVDYRLSHWNSNVPCLGDEIKEK